MLKRLLMPLIVQDGSISLRALDWLVTNYAKKNNIVCRTHNNDLFNIYHGYKVALAHWRRRNFDPFRRRQRISFELDNEHIETTVGQLNFLHWAHVNGVFDYAVLHSACIEKDMNAASSKHKAERKKMKHNGLPHKRKELSRAPQTKCHVYGITTAVSFDDGESNLNDSESEAEREDET